MADNEFILDEVLVNQNFKAAINLLNEKNKKKEPLTLLEQALTKWVRLNWCLAELMGPYRKDILTDIAKENKIMSQFPEFRKVFKTIDFLKDYYTKNGLQYTPVEQAFMRYLEVATRAGMHIAGRNPDEKEPK